MRIFINEHEILLKVIWHSLALDVFWLCVAFLIYVIGLQTLAFVIIILIKLVAGSLDAPDDLSIYGRHMIT